MISDTKRDLRRAVIARFGGRIIDNEEVDQAMAEMGPDIEDLDQLLAEVGVSDKFTAHELFSVKRKSIAKRVGITQPYLVPDPCDIYNVLAPLKVIDYLRNKTEHDAPINLLHAWRPELYNRAVGGAEQSDHLTATAIDCDFTSRSHYRRAVHELKRLYAAEPWLQLSLGIDRKNHTRLHLGVLSPKGRRMWYYE